MALRRWIAGKISDILGSEDDVVTELCFNLIEGSSFVSLLPLSHLPSLMLPSLFCPLLAPTDPQYLARY